MAFYYHWMIYLFEPHALHASSYLLKSRATYLFPDMKIFWWGGGGLIPVIRFRGLKAALQWHSVLSVVILCFDVNLCRNRRQHKENNFIWGSLYLGSWGFPSPPLPWSMNREPLPLSVNVSLFHREKVQLSIFTCAPKKLHLPIPVYSYLLYHISSYILSIFTLKAPYCIYIIPDFFFYCECFFVLHPDLFGSLLVAHVECLCWANRMLCLH